MWNRLSTQDLRCASQSQAIVGNNPEVSSGSCEVLPWGVYRKNVKAGTFVARILWPTSMWETVKGLGYVHKPDSRGSSWRHIVGRSKKPLEARNKIETFIHKLPRELKALLIA